MKHHGGAVLEDRRNGDLRGERPRRRDAAFLDWVRKFTKGKRPP
jgi:hypothetical protein